MPRGRPDWYGAGQSNIVSTMNDHAELAVRLGSCVNYDRTGKTIFIDVFDRLDALYEFNNRNVVVAPAVNTTRAEYGGSSIKAVIGVGVNNYCTFNKYMRTWVGKVLAIEYAINTDVMPSKIDFGIALTEDEEQYYALCRLDTNCTEIKVYDSTLNYRLLKTEARSPVWVKMFNTLRMNFNLETKKYISVQINDKVYDASEYNIWSPANTEPNHLLGFLGIYGYATANLKMYVDRLILSEDE